MRTNYQSVCFLLEFSISRGTSTISLLCFCCSASGSCSYNSVSMLMRCVSV
uniref:Uncharacterized protein n=1 Tax=Arundo donax TaxID=35708 RepID=A0A0A9HER3_ARUDO